MKNFTLNAAEKIGSVVTSVITNSVVGVEYPLSAASAKKHSRKHRVKYASHSIFVRDGVLLLIGTANEQVAIIQTGLAELERTANAH